jgi:hypothetical protein
MWTRVSVKNVKDGVQWCRDNLSYNDWVCGEGDGSIQFRFRDEAIAIEFALRF